MIPEPSEEELALFAIFMDESGIDQAEFCLEDPTNEETDNIFRAWPVQVFWWRRKSNKLVTAGSRSCGKTLSIRIRSLSFPYLYPGEEMVIAAPDGEKVKRITDHIEVIYETNFFAKSMLVKGRKPITKRPFIMSFDGGGHIRQAIPRHDGSGLRGIHPMVLMQDEAQDFTPRAWKELPETIQRKVGAKWLAFGVTTGPGNTFDDKITGQDSSWDVIKLPAMYRPTWDDEERAEKIETYRGYEDIDYQRNVLGSADGADSSLVVWARLLGNCVDTDDLSDYNTNEYYKQRISDGNRRDMPDILDFVDPPFSHINRYKDFWIGMDYGLTTSDTCILVFAQTLMEGEKHSRIKLLSNISMSRISTPEQFQVVKHLLTLYRPKIFSFDAHGIGDGVFQLLQDEIKRDPDLSWILDRIIGYSFSKKMIVGFDNSIEINLNVDGDWKRSAIEKLTSDASLDYLRKFVDDSLIYLPYDKDLLAEIKAVPKRGMQQVDEYNKAKRKQGGHQLDALRFNLLAKGNEEVRDIVKEYEDSWTPAPMILLDYN